VGGTYRTYGKSDGVHRMLCGTDICCSLGAESSEVQRNWMDDLRLQVHKWFRVFVDTSAIWPDK
jgi:hypothetical protein